MNYVIYDPMVAMKLDLKMKGFTCPIYNLSDVIEHKDEVISPGNSYFCVGESVFKFILKNYHLGRGIKFFSTATMIPKITTIDGIKFTFIRDLKSSKFNDKRDYFLSDAFNKTIRLIPEDKRIITRDLQVGMKYLKEWISGDRPYRFGFGLDYETADVGMGHKKICGVGISSIFDSIYIDFRYPKSQEEWEEFSDVYREFCTKYQDVTWTHHSFFEFSRTDETFGVWCDFHDTTGVNVVEGRNMIHYSLKFTAQLILGVKSWDDSFDLLTDSLGKIQSKYKTLDRFLDDKDAVSEFKSKFIDEDDWNDWVELAKNNPQYWNDKFYLQTYRNLGKYCCLDAYYTLMIAAVEWDKYPERCWKLCLDNLRLGNHLHKTGAILDKDKRERLKRINEKFLCYSMFKILSGYYKLKITPLDTTFLNKLSPTCQNIINRGYNPVSSDFWKSLIPSVTDTKDPQSLDEYKLARIVGQEMTERVRRYLKNKGRKLSGYTRSKTLRDDFERYRKDLYTESDEKLIKDNKSLIDRARANKNYGSKLKILNQSELAQMDFDTTDHYSQYEFAGRKRSFREIYDILRKQWLNVGSNEEFDKIRSTIVNYKGAIPASFAVNSYKKTKYMKILFGDEFDQNPGKFYDEYYKIMDNEEFDKIPDRLTKPRDRKLDPGAVYNNLQNPCHSMWSRWASREEFKPIYQGIKTRANKFIAEWEYDYEVPLQMIRALYIFKAYSKEMQYLEGIFAKKIQKVKWTDPFLRYYVVKDDGDFDDYRIQPKFDICMKITKRSSSGFHTIPSDSPSKGCIKCPDGYGLSYFDISQAEPRSCAYLLDRDKMMEYYETGKDLYYVCAASMMGISYEELKKLPNAKQYRTQFKVILLGLIYGEGAQSLADKLGITLEESKRSIRVLFDNFPQLEKGIYHKKKYPAAHNREIETLWGDTLVSPPTSPDKLERAGINYAVQGGTSIALSAGFYNVVRLCDDNKMPARPVLQVHDALISYFDLSMIWDLNEFYYQAFTEYLYKITGVRYAFSVCFGMDYYNKCDSRNLDPDNLELVGSNRGILQILEGLDKIGVRYEIVEKDSDIVPVEEITMKKYNRNYGELVSYDEDVTKNRVVIKRLDPPRFYVPKLQY